MTPAAEAVLRALDADPPALAAQEALERAGGQVFAVGGAVRDAVLGVEPKDVDLLVTGLPPHAVRRALGALPGRVDLTGATFGVFRYRRRGREAEIALPRMERSTGDRHRDFEVTVDPQLAVEDDLARRDFTANALAVELATGELVDPFGGCADIEARVLRTVSPRSFEDDPLRIVRALVAYARHGLRPDAETARQMREHAARVRHLPGERLHAELRKLMAAPDPVPALRLAHEAGVLAEILPELDAAFGFDQRVPGHQRDLGEHLLAVLAGIEALSDDVELRLAALLHDVGKPEAQQLDEDGTAHYHGHADAGATIARRALRRLRFADDATDRVARLVRLHAFPSFETPHGARRFLRRAGSPETARELLLLRQADRAARVVGDDGAVAVLRELVERELEAQAPHAVSQLAVDGHDLLALGIPRGPEIGRVLRELLDRVVADPALNERETLLALARELAS